MTGFHLVFCKVNELCEMLNDHQIMDDKDYPQEVWDFLKKNGFFAMIIPKEYGTKVICCLSPFQASFRGLIAGSRASHDTRNIASVGGFEMANVGDMYRELHLVYAWVRVLPIYRMCVFVCSVMGISIIVCGPMYIHLCECS